MSVFESKRQLLLFVGFLIAVNLCAGAALSQPADIAKQLQQYVLSSNIELFVLRIFELLLAGVAAALLYGNAVVKRNGRFLGFLSAVYAIECVATLALVIGMLFIDHVATQALNPALEIDKENSKKLIDAISQTIEGVDLSLSFFSSFCMLIAWYLLYRFPQQKISNEFFAAGVGILAVLIAVVAAVTAAASAVALPILDVFDTISSTLVAVMVGWGLWSYNPKAGSRPLALAVMFCFVLWGLANAFYWLIEKWSPELRMVYGAIIFFVGFAAAVLTVIYSALFMEDKSSGTDREGEVRPLV